MALNPATNDLWQRQPDLYRRFVEAQPNHEKLGEEVAYILGEAMKAEGIEFSAVIHRVKTLDSIREKVGRKEYKDPVNAITDFSGVRVVYLYTAPR